MLWCTDLETPLAEKVATKSPGFNIIKEYTLDKANSTVGAPQDKSEPDNQNLHPGNVETPSSDYVPTTSTDDKVETATDTANSSKASTSYATTGDHRTSLPLQSEVTGSDTKRQVCAQSEPADENNIVSESSEKHSQPALHVATRNKKPLTGLNPAERPDMPINADQSVTGVKEPLTSIRPVTCPEDSLVLVQYPWKCELKVKLDRIEPLEIDIWSKKVRDYHIFSETKGVAPIISEVKGYGLRTRPIKAEPPADDPNDDKTDQLIDQAQALINMTKTFVTKPVSRKQPRK